MPSHVVLLRGINVGRNKRVAMADLRALLSSLGYADVRTHLQSGNAVFTSSSTDQAELVARIEGAIAEQLGMTVRCVVRSAAEVRAVVDGNPLTAIATDGAKLLALFLSQQPDPALLAEHDPTELSADQIRLGDRVVYQWCPDGVLAAPPVSAFVEKHLGVVVTGRNWNTVTKLATLLEN